MSKERNPQFVAATPAVIPHRPGPVSFDYGVSAGAVLREELDAIGLTQAELAGRTGLSTKHVNQVIKEVVPLSTDSALRIERAIGLSADLLTSVEAAHQASRGRADAQQRMTEYLPWFSKFPVAALKARGIVSGSSAATQVGELLAFFGVADPVAYDRYYDSAVMSFRRAQHLEVNPHATAVWLRLAERAALVREMEPYDKSGFAELVPQLPELTTAPFAIAYPQLVERCATYGVCVAFIPDVDGARASAATRWVTSERPVIALTARGGFEDSVWFSFFHECGHVLKHPKRKSLVHLTGDGDDGDGAESEANKFAQDTLLRGHDIACVVALATSPARAAAVAKKLRIDPGIVGGQMAYRLGGPGFAKFRSTRRKLDSGALVGK